RRLPLPASPWYRRFLHRSFTKGKHPEGILSRLTNQYSDFTCHFRQGGVTLIKVLIADNNMPLCASLSDFLNGLPDMEVVGCAYDGEEALELIAKTQPDVVILAITMPRLDGMAVLERLPDLKLERRPRIIVLTGLAREDIAKPFTELGADYFLLKPFDLQLLAERIRQFANERPAEPAPVAPAPARPPVSRTHKDRKSVV